ncbi:pyridoxamine 5'-phosphate oxidase family protein [Streptomyces sp. NPDC047017]|uniref:pyridoxamine 5'-phosphate oxidase family protein n=1 Tax=Streptomyces sp. NPDC047017 TaxID=3155024 RepID=UPI0033F866FF
MDRNDGFRELGRQECLRLLATAPVGRVVYTRQALPAVLPVNFGLDDEGAVLLRTSAASELARAIDGAVVAFEADAVDAAARSGWSVVVTGAAAVVADPAQHRRLVQDGPRSWVSSPAEVFLRIEPALVTGRELVGGRSLYGLGSFPVRSSDDSACPTTATGRPVLSSRPEEPAP